ncbi:MAG: 30S ribosomal protein S1 [gamma proteobacterium endosymbiont of Trioza apicalis]
MKESFAKIFEKSLKTIKIKIGSIIYGTVISINKDMVLVDADLKSESLIPVNQFYDINGELEIKIGDKVEVVLDTIENGFGETLLSRDKAKRYKSWLLLDKAYQKNNIVIGMITNKVKGGFTVELNGIRAFLPGSLIDTKPICDTSSLENKNLEFKIIKLDKKSNNIVVSRRAIIEIENNNERNQLLSYLKENSEIFGIVKNLTDYGAFIDLGGIDGLLHITDMSWRRIKHPNEIVNIGDEIKVKVLRFDYERIRVSLGLKQLIEDPWIDIIKRYPEGFRLNGKVTNITDYGCFVEIENGIEGLVHTSEMDWINKNINPNKLVKVGDIVKVIILNVDKDKHRISLGIKQCKPNPWKYFYKIYKKGNYIEGKIKSITDLGIFVSLKNGIDGLIHQSDMSWNINLNKFNNKYKKGNKITVSILQIDSNRERISLGIKKLYEDPFNNFISLNKRGKIIFGEIIEINAKGLTVKLKNHVKGFIHISEIYNIKCKKLILIFKIGDIIKSKFTSINRKNCIINLSTFF